MYHATSTNDPPRLYGTDSLKRRARYEIERGDISNLSPVVRYTPVACTVEQIPGRGMDFSSLLFSPSQARVRLLKSILYL